MPWNGVTTVNPHDYTCGYCGKEVGSISGWRHQENTAWFLYVCPRCWRPTYIDSGTQVPGVAFGGAVAHLPSDVEALYREIRNGMSAGVHTCVLLACRKMLMHVAVEQGATEGQSFVAYVEYLSDKGFVPPNGKHWVDYIRKEGNEKSHEISMANREEAERLVTFVEMLLRFVYEFPNSVPRSGNEGGPS